MGLYDTDIDPNNLIEEVFAVSNSANRASFEANESLELVDNQKVYLDYLKGRKKVDFYSGKEKIEGLGEGIKLTDKIVEAAISSDSEIIEETKKYNKLKKDHAIAKSFAVNMDGKKWSLATAVKLALAGWFPLHITNVEDVENFMDKHIDDVEKKSEREVLRERRRRRSSAEGED
jgi:hypothetical protein